MPRFDGTGPQGEGPFTGRSEGYCAVAYPKASRPYGYAGVQGQPVNGLRLTGRRRLFGLFQRGIGRGRGGRGRGRGRQPRW